MALTTHPPSSTEVKERESRAISLLLYGMLYGEFNALVFRDEVLKKPNVY
jgi:hypothetical protein